MNIGQVIHFHNERFFEGAVQLSWIQRREDQARKAAEAFVFHGPRYHGAVDAEREGIEETYKLKDTASFVRDLLASMSFGSEGQEVNPYWLVVAGYGSGKSHLALTCAALLAEPTSETASKIIQQIRRADSEIGERVTQQVAEMNKPALVLPLDGMAGFHLGNALSRAVFQQMRRYHINADAIRDLSPRFKTAGQFVERNFAFRESRFGEQLPEMNEEQICAHLRQNDEAVYSAVDAVYTEANGHPIPVEGQESAQELIDTLCNVYCGSDGPFSHVIILFDELGRYLEYASEKPQLAGDFALQQIFQGVQDNSTKVRFIGFIQYELKAYLKRFSGADLRQLQRYVTRFDTAEKWYLSTNLETIFAHMIGKREEVLEQLWQDTNAERQAQTTRERLSPYLPGFSRFPVWSDPDRFERVITKGCWPLHPLAVWFLTRQRDLVQSRSALTFIKDIIDRIANEDAQVDGRLRQVSAAELVVGSMLPEMLSAERETGGTTAETLQMLLEKYDGHLNHQQQMALAGVAVAEKTRMGKQTREVADALLCEATALESESLPTVLETLFELGAVEWNDDLGQYELLSDGATRGQFQQWVRAKQSELSADGIRDLFIRRVATDMNLTNITPDFSESHDISTPDWFFEAQLAHLHTVENSVRTAMREWQKGTLPKDAKGKVIYLYLHPDDDPVSVGERVKNYLDAELKRADQTQAPIWVIGISDQSGRLSDHIGRLYLFDELMSEGDHDRFRRFVSEERERSHGALKVGVQEAIKDRLYWIAGFPEVPTGRLRVIGMEIFSKVYPNTIPFPFDGFGSAAGGGPGDSVQLMRGLIARQVNGPWVQSQPRRLQNRINAVLVESWKVLLRSGKLVTPSDASVGTLYKWLEQSHRDNPKRTLLDSYRALIAPPHGLNASSAGMLLSLLLGLDSPPRRIEQAGELVASTDWLQQVFPGKRGQQHLDEGVLEASCLRFLSDDSEGRWRSLLSKWEAARDYKHIVEYARKAEKMLTIDPLPETLEGNYKYLNDISDKKIEELRSMAEKIRNWEAGIEKAEKRKSLEHAIRIGGQVIGEHTKMDENGNWPDEYLSECNSLLKLVHEQITREIADWIPRQNCRSVPNVIQFRQLKEIEADGLEKLGFRREAQALTRQAQQSIAKVERLQKFSLTLHQCDDYPRQPEPTASTTVRALRDDIALGDDLVNGIQNATDTLSEVEIAAHVQAIQQRQDRLKEILQRQLSVLATIYEQEFDDYKTLIEALTKINHLRDIFVDTPDVDDISELTVQLQRIKSDVGSWEASDVSVERLEELLEHQIEHQLVVMHEFLEEQEIDPAWDMPTIYKTLGEERLIAARQRSIEWVQRRSTLAEKLEGLDRQSCNALRQELDNAPSYLSTRHSTQVKQMLQSVEGRLGEFEELERQEKVSKWQRRYLKIADVGQLDYHATEKLLQEISKPPYELRHEERMRLDSITNQLTTHLDQISMDDLFSRIEQLQERHQLKLLERLSTLLAR